MSKQELKPCPRGHKAKISQGSFGTFIVTCIEPDCPWSLNDEYDTPEWAVTCWNTRHEAPTESEKDARIRELEAVNELLARNFTIESEKDGATIQSLTAQIKEMREALKRIEKYEQSPFQSPYSVIQDIKSLAKYPEAKQ